MALSKVLIAEDDPDLRALFAEALEGDRYGVRTAADGEEALSILKDTPGIDVLVSDIRMPVMNGFQLSEAGLEVRPELKILLMTGYGDVAPPPLLRARAIRILHKPVKLDWLRELVGEMLDRP